MTNQPNENTNEQLVALDNAEEQQLAVLAKTREAALEAAKYWEGVVGSAGSAGSESGSPSAGVPEAWQPSPVALTTANFAYLETVIKAQYAFTRTLLERRPS
jgi:hypothetical protein